MRGDMARNWRTQLLMALGVSMLVAPCAALVARAPVQVPGTPDPIFSINGTVAWWDRLDQFDALASVVGWVEKGAAPDRIPAQSGPMSPFRGRSRSLCPYPSIARYVSGDAEKAESFACATS